MKWKPKRYINLSIIREQRKCQLTDFNFFLLKLKVEVSSSLQSEWESFEKMISGEIEEKPSSVQEFLQAGIVAYPGLFQNTENSDEDKKPSSDSDDGGKIDITS